MGSPVPSENSVDLEDIAALIDGRLKGAERQRVVEHLAEDEASYEVFQEVLQLQDSIDLGSTVDIEEAPDSEELTEAVSFEARQSRPAAWRRWMPSAGLAMAAMLATVVIGLSIGGRLNLVPVNPDALPVNSAQLVVGSLESAKERSDLGPLVDRLDAEWFSRGKRITRGSARANDMDRVDFQLGVQIIDLHIAFETAKIEEAKAVTRQLLSLLRNDERSIFFQDQIASCESLLAGLTGGEALSSLDGDRQRLEKELRNAAEKVFFDFGRWVEAGRLAATAGQSEFFVDRKARRMLERIEQARLHDSVPGLMQQVLAEGSVGSPEAMREIEKNLVRIAQLSGARL